MAEHKNLEQADQEVVDKAVGFWNAYGKKLSIGIAALVILVGGYWAYGIFVQAPKEQKANEEIFMAESFFRKDSFNLALNGNAATPGLLKVISKYDGTQSANLARLYAGECYLQLGEFQKAIDQLEKFSSNGAKQVEAKVEGLLGDAYAELKKNEEAIAHYKKAGTLFPDDQAISSEYLFRGALLSEMSNKNEEAIELYQLLKEKYPRTDKGFVVDKYLARLGVVR